MALSLEKEMREFPGGSTALAKAVSAAAEAIRPIRWPAERLDTLGGYLTYHNITLFIAFLCLFAIVQGAKIIRGAEESHALEVLLSTGISRARVIIDKSLGFAIAMFMICLGLGAATALSMWACGQPDIYGSFFSFVGGFFAIFYTFAVTLLFSQFSKSYKSAAGVTTIAMVILYISNNLSEKMGVFGNIKFLSPTYYSNLTRPLVPGHGVHWVSMLFMLLTGIVLTQLSITFFSKRDLGSGYFAKSGGNEKRENQTLHFHRRPLWRSIFYKSRVALASWTLMSAAFLGMLILLEPSVAEVWDLIKWLGISSDQSQAMQIEIQYISISTSLLPPIISGYVAQQSATWVNELKQGRLELYLSTRLNWRNLTLQRIGVTTIGCALIAVVSMSVLVSGALFLDISVSAFGVFRVLVLSIACGISISVIAILVVSIFPHRESVIVLATYIGISYIISYVANILEWPEWVQKVSIFYSFGTPYQAWPSLSNSTMITFFLIPGVYLATKLAKLSPKVA
jgi:ABC-2 type transport system permease protein